MRGKVLARWSRFRVWAQKLIGAALLTYYKIII